MPDGTVYLPGKKDLDAFLGDCYNANAAQFASCMAAKGWIGSNGEDMVTYSVYRSSFTDFHMSPYANGESRTAEQENRTLCCDYSMRDLGYPGFGIFPNMKINGLVLGADGNPRLGAGCAKGTEANMLLFQTIPASKRDYN